MKITLLTGQTFDIQQALGINIKIIKSPRAKKLTLRIDTQERLPVLTVPKRCSVKRASEFVRQNMGWIEENLDKIPESRRFENGETISLFGKKYTICHIPKLRKGVFIEGETLYVSGAKEFMHRRICDFIKKMAQQELYELSRQKAEEIGCRVKRVLIKDTKSRWGSCSSISNINYNWRIALAPTFVIKYLVAHEVSHLRHQDHSRDFWNCVCSLYTRSAEGRRWLKNHGRELYLYE